jgi:hypothetical protein
MSRCGIWWIHVFRFSLILLYHQPDQPLPFHIEQTFWITGSLIGGFLDRRVQHCLSIVPSPANNTRTSPIYKLANKFPFFSFAFAFCLLGPFSECVVFSNVSCFCIQHLKFRNIQIDPRNPSLSLVLCYSFCNQ